MNRSTLILVAAALTVGLYVWLVEIGGDEAREESERETRRFLALDADAIHTLELPLEDGGRARLVREGDSWRLEQPRATAADALAVGGITSALADLESRAVIEDADDLPRYGLGPDSTRVEIWANGEEPLVLALGKEVPIGGEVYALVESDSSRVYTIDFFRKQTFVPGLTALRDKRISRLEPDAVTALRVVEEGQLVVRIERQPVVNEEDPLWRVVEPIEDAGDERRIGRLLQDLSLARARAFIDEPRSPGEYGLDAPDVELELLAGETSERLSLARGENVVYVARGGGETVFEVPERVLDQIPRKSFAYRDKTVMTIDAARVHQLELHFPRDGESHSFVRDGRRWRPSGEGLEVSTVHIEDLLYGVAELEATGIESSDDRAALGLEPPLVRAVALDETGTELGWIELGDPEPGVGTPALSSRSDRIWRVINDVGEMIPLGKSAFEARWLESDASEAPAESAQDLE